MVAQIIIILDASNVILDIFYKISNALKRLMGVNCIQLMVSVKSVNQA